MQGGGLLEGVALSLASRVIRRLGIERPEGSGVYKEAVLGVWVDAGSVLSDSKRILRSDPYRATHEAQNLVYEGTQMPIHKVLC